MKTNRWVLSFAAAAMLAACGTTDLENAGDPPELPLEESMIFDTETFPSAGGGQASGVQRQVQSGSHHTAAALGVVGINLAVLAVTSVPRLTWAALATRQPTFEDGQWHWRGSTSILGVQYSGDLTGYTDDGDVVAEVRITSPAVSDFLWYDGRAPIGGNSGQWRVFDASQPSTPSVVATIDWSRPVSDEWNLTFTALAGNNPGDELAYDVDGDMRSVTWYDASEDMTYGIRWDAVTREGSITAAGYNGGQMSCWDGDLMNVACS